MRLDSNVNDRPVAIFDFDGTLTTGDSLMPFLKYVVGTPRYYAKLALLSPVLAAYFAKCLRNDIAKQIVLKQYLAGYDIHQLSALGERFSEKVIPTMLRSEGMERLRWHRSAGHRCVLVSASINVYLNTWAKKELFSELICTTLEQDAAGYLSGSIEGKNCYGEEKLRRVLERNDGFRGVPMYAYGDSPADVALLKYVNHGFIWNQRTRQFVSV